MKKIVCHADGDRCLGCSHYQGKSDVCEFAPIPDLAQAAGGCGDEIEDLRGDAATLRGFIREFEMTPSMMASERDHWRQRALMNSRPTVGPFRIERHDMEGGAIAYEIWDYFTGTYHRLCTLDDSDNPYAKHDAELIAEALNARATSVSPAHQLPPGEVG